jgi:hypothetical protein
MERQQKLKQIKESCLTADELNVDDEEEDEIFLAIRFVCYLSIYRFIYIFFSHCREAKLKELMQSGSSGAQQPQQPKKETPKGDDTRKKVIRC